jgi:hypothetical protein
VFDKLADLKEWTARFQQESGAEIGQEKVRSDSDEAERCELVSKVEAGAKQGEDE